MSAPEVDPSTSGRRPNTIPPQTFISLDSETERSMTDEQLIGYLDFYHSVRMPLGTPRSVLISKLDSIAVAARDV